MSSVRIVRCLGVVSVISGLLIVGANLLTKDRIRENQELIMRETVAQLMPGAEKQLAFAVAQTGELTRLTESSGVGRKMYAGYDRSGKLLGVVLEASERGYADMISAMYVYDPATKTVTGFRVVELRETPGLGDKIGKDPAFLENFRKLETTHPITAVKNGTKKNPWEIDAISGATISSRTVGRLLEKGVREMAPIIARNLERIERGAE